MRKTAAGGFDIRDLPHSTLALYAGGIALAVAGVLAALIWYTGMLEPAPEQVGSPPSVVDTRPTAETPAPRPSPVADQITPPRKVKVANTGGIGAVIRAEPSTDAKVVVGAPEGSSLDVIGPDVQAEGRTWRNVSDDKGNKGFIAGELVRPAS